MLTRANCSVIFITAASDMDTCSQAIRNGAFDYILKPVSWKRLSQSLERFVQFAEQQRSGRLSTSRTSNSLYQLQAKNYRLDNGSKGIEENTLARVQALFNDKATHCFSVDEVVQETGLSKNHHPTLSGALRGGGVSERRDVVREDWASAEDV